MPELSNVASSDIYKSAETPKGMSLADMLNISRSSLALQKEKELYEPLLAIIVVSFSVVEPAIHANSCKI